MSDSIKNKTRVGSYTKGVATGAKNETLDKLADKVSKPIIGDKISKINEESPDIGSLFQVGVRAGTLLVLSEFLEIAKSSAKDSAIKDSKKSISKLQNYMREYAGEMLTDNLAEKVVSQIPDLLNSFSSLDEEGEIKSLLYISEDEDTQ